MKARYSAILVSVALICSVAVMASGLSQANGKDKDIERMDFIHYFKAKGGGGGAKTDNCYKLMGVKWIGTPVSYAINPSNQQGLSEDFILSAVSASAETWDAATTKELFAANYTVDYTAQYGVSDGKNAIAFGNYPSNGVIAVTSVWMNKRTKQIVEFDQLYNTQFAWGDASSDPSKMDLQNIATHELGHAVGLSDLYTSLCTAVTMYGYSSEGEISKRTLEQPDITGLQKMYGA